MEERFILIQMVLPNIKKEMVKIKNEVVEPEMEPEMEEAEEPEEVEERVFNHLQQQRKQPQRKQFQPSDLYETLWFLLIIHISKVILYSLFISFYSPFFAGKRLLSESMNPLLLRNNHYVINGVFKLMVTDC